MMEVLCCFTEGDAGLLRGNNNACKKKKKKKKKKKIQQNTIELKRWGEEIENSDEVKKGLRYHGRRTARGAINTLISSHAIIVFFLFATRFFDF